MADEKSGFSPFARQCFVTATVCSNVIGFGCAFGFPGVLLPQLQQADSSIMVTNDQSSWLASVASIMMVFGNFIIPAVMSRVGRKMAHLFVTLVILLGWGTIILASSFEVLLVGRILQGLSFGLYITLRSVLIGEWTSPRHRGGFLATSSLCQTFGILLVHLTGSLLSYQLTAIVAMSFSIISFVLTIFCPESPSWLATKGQYDKCRKNFLWLRGEEELPELDQMIQTMNHSAEQQNQDQNKLKGMVRVMKKKEFHKPILLMFALYIMMPCSGSLIMGTYPITILNLLMGPSINAYVWLVILDCQRLLFSVVAIYVINKIKRRTMMFATGALCVGSQLSMAAYLFSKSKGILPFDLLWIPFILISLQMMSISTGMQPLPAVISGEVFPLQHRGLAGSISFVANCAAVFIILKAFPSLISAVGLHGAFVLYSGVMVACMCVAWVLLPETSGRTLEQIEEHFRGMPLPDPEADKEMELLNRLEGKLSTKVEDKDKTAQELLKS